ncbi:CLIP domain-containing serine protease 2-like [Zerene cesonia]|uniref:CLIP domain-containing serine protease 2-like n=1 Tax=Zerene cesonia TaxID=33412 RepID=UPI0018E5779F|nr:CLIP domain-containing serine protease 2-like [Zerene cesonia]
MLHIVIVFGLLLIRDKIECKVCNDCMELTRCPGALAILTEDADTDTKQEFQNQFCGVKYVFGDRIPQVCCSDFARPPNENLMQHRNFFLLPNSCGVINVTPNSSPRAKLYEFPWLALIATEYYLGEKFVCDGVIISSLYILTTAACAETSLSFVRVGDYNPDTAIDCMPDNVDVCEDHTQNIYISEIIKHPKYVGSIRDIRNNLALLRLREPIDFSFRNVAPICLPIQANQIYNSLNETGTIVGWLHNGIYELRDYGQLQKFQQVIKPQTWCKTLLSRFKMNVTSMENSFCVFTHPNGICNTIAGDPFMIIRKYNLVNRYILQGIYSHGTKECIGNAPEVFVDVTKMVGWILDTIQP